jgi:hypothetical protein
MVSFFKNDMKRAFGNKGFFVSVAMLLVILIHAIRVNVNFEGNPSTYEIISAAMALSGVTPFAAIFPVMGYSVAFCEEYHSGYIKMITSRINWKSFGIVRMITTGVAGGAVIALPFAAVNLIGYVCGKHGMPDTGLYMGTRMQYYLENYGDGYILFGKVVLGFLFGVLWALVGLAFSVWCCNRYVSLIAPFILYEVMWLLLYNIQVLNPIYLIRGDDLNSYPLSGIVEILYIMVAIIIILIGLRRKEL